MYGSMARSSSSSATAAAPSRRRGAAARPRPWRLHSDTRPFTVWAAPGLARRCDATHSARMPLLQALAAPPAMPERSARPRREQLAHRAEPPGAPQQSLGQPPRDQRRVRRLQLGELRLVLASAARSAPALELRLQLGDARASRTDRRDLAARPAGAAATRTAAAPPRARRSPVRHAPAAAACGRDPASR